MLRSFRWVRIFCACSVLAAVLPGAANAQGADCFGSEAQTALTACETALQHSDALTPSETAAFQRAQAGHLLSLERHAEALAVLDMLSEYDSASDQYHFRRATALLALGNRDAAQAALNTALDLNPQHLDSLLMRAGLSIDTDQLDQAIADAGLAATLAPENPQANRVMADALNALGASDAAARSQEAAEAAETTTDATAPILPTASQIETTTETAPTPSATATATASGDVELVFWNDVKDSNSPEEISLFLTTFPNSVFAPLARLRMNAMSGTTAAPRQEVVIVLPQTRPLQITAGEDDENLAITALELPQGDYLIAGGRTRNGRSGGQPWLALYGRDGRLKWERYPEIDKKQGFVADAALLPNNRFVISQVQLDEWNEASLGRLIAFDFSGAELWHTDVGGLAADFGFVSLTALSDGGILAVASSAAEDKTKANSRLIKLAGTGEILWQTQLDIPGADAAIAAVESGGNLLVSGSVDTADDDIKNAWVRKFTANGSLIWQRTLHSRKRSFASDILGLDNGDAIVMGTATKDGHSEIWLHRIDAAGKNVWERRFRIGTETEGFRFAKLSDNEFAIAGTARTDNYDDGSVGWVVWFDSDGIELARSIYGDHAKESIYGITATHDGGLILTGQIAGTGSFDKTAWVSVLAPRALYDPYEFTATRSAVLSDCVLMAAHPSDSQNPYGFPGLAWDDFDAEFAEQSCRMAAALFPDDAVARYHMGRVQHKLENYAQAIIHYKAAIKYDHVRALAGLGVLLTESPEVFQNNQQAAQLFTRAVELENDPLSALMLGGLYAAGDGVDYDTASAARYYRIAADGGIAEAQFRLAESYRDGWGVETNITTAILWYEKARDLDHAGATRELAFLYHWGISVTQDRFRAHRLYQKAADLGDGEAIYKIAMAYRWGNEVVKRNDVIAATWLQRAINKGIAPANADLGFLYQWGNGVTMDKSRALQLYRAGVSAGDGGSHYYLGKMYQDGVEVAQSNSEAIRLYRIAVDKGQTSAMVALGYMHRDGVGLTVSDTAAFDLFQAASDSFHTGGDREAGWMRYLGRGVTKDIPAAITQIKKATATGSDGLAAIYLGYIYDAEASLRDPERAAGLYYDGLSLGEDWPTTLKAKDWNRATARALQRRLRDAGYYNGAIDGSMGPNSVAAMKALCRC